MAGIRNKSEIVELLKNLVIEKLETEFDITHFVAEREAGYFGFGWWEDIQKLADDVSLGKISEDDAKRQLSDSISTAYPQAIPKNKAPEHKSQVGIPEGDEKGIILLNEYYTYYYLPDRTTLVIDALSEYWPEIVTGGLYDFFDNHPEFGDSLSLIRSQREDILKVAHEVFMAQSDQKRRRNRTIPYYEYIITTPPYGKDLVEQAVEFGADDKDFKKFLRERYEEQYESEMRLYGIADRPRNADEFVNSFIKWLPTHFPKIRRR
jgi:hypothetical protein